MTLSCLKSPLLCTLYTNLSHLTTTLFFMCYFVYSLRVMMCVCRILIKITYLALLIGPAEKLSHIFSSAIFNSETVLGFGSRFQNSFASSSRDESAYSMCLLYFFRISIHSNRESSDVALVRISEKVKQRDNFVYAITKYVLLQLTLSSLTVTVTK